MNEAAKKHPGGAPSKFTHELREKILEDIRHFVPYELAAEANGIAHDTLWLWLRQAREDLRNDIDSEKSQFLKDIKRAEADRMNEDMHYIRAGEENWQARAWYNERRWHKYFSLNSANKEILERLDEIEANSRNKE